jgi:hypothetical protein
MTTPTAASGGTGARESRFNRFLVRWLTSPLGGLSGRVVLVRYTGRVSGLPRRLPVNCEPFESGFLIRVGKPEQKRWWRNFRSPWPMELVRKGRRISGSAVVVSGETGSGQRIAADYFARHHGAARRAGLPKMHKGEVPTPEALQAAAAQLVFVIVTPDS